MKSALHDYALNSTDIGITLLEAMRDEQDRVTDLRVVLINDAAVTLTHCSREDLLSHSLLTLFQDETQQALIRKLYPTLETGVKLQTERYEPDEDRWLAVTVTRPELNYLSITITDITHRRRASSAQREQTALINKVLDTVQSGVILSNPIYDETSKIVDFQVYLCNQRCQELTDFNCEAMIGSTLLSLDPDSATNGTLARYIRVLQTGQTERSEQFFIPRNRWFEHTTSTFGQGIIDCFTDITALKEEMQRHQQTAKYLQSILDNSPAGIALFEAIRDEQGQIIDFSIRLTNQANARSIGLPIEVLLGERLLQRFPGTQPTGFFERLLKTTETGESQRFVMSYQEDNLDVWIEAALQKQNDGALFTFLDITENRNYQLQLERSNQDLRRSNENLQQFAYVASHDLQEPLRKVQSFGDILLDQFGNGMEPEAQDLLRRMQLAAVRMSALIRDLLMYSRLATHQQTFQTLSLQDLIQEVISDLEFPIQERKATIEVDPLPELVGDPLQLRQLFQNLLTNALKFTSTSQTPHIEIRCHQVEANQIPGQETTPQIQPYWQIDLKDNGIGFDEKYLDRIFQLFQRLHGKSSYTGTGIGLAICKKVVENHQGYITAHSQAEQGATFSIFLPVRVSSSSSQQSNK
ncbi:PAS domain-containing sensor histidine kinase [Tellurirhabdus bombi]|uniref:PAS domain-containing sensor histidine kinase n=1 Tax=Tellurirhabdus bombi TaxID=2907205 RepID=UPI001F1EFB51|nr:ATP-binding protein [Tellurirhabdus bombi]